MYNISEFSKLIGVNVKTLRDWDKNGKLIPIKLESGHRRYTNEHLNKFINNTKERLNICYIRESTIQQKNSLMDQESKVKQFCISNGLNIDKLYSDFGSGLNYKRNNFQKILSHIINNEIENLIIYYKDRLVRFGFEIFEYFSQINRFNIIIIDDSETEKSKDQEFAEDLISIIHYFSMKLYGSRSYKNKIKKAEDNILEIRDEIIEN